MNTIKYITAIITALALTSCTGNYLEINTNPFEVSKEDMQMDGYAISAAMSALCSGVISTDVNTCQFTDALLGGPMGGYYSTTGAFAYTIDNFNATDDWTNPFMASPKVIPVIMNNIREIRNLTDDPVTLAIANIIKVAAFHRITDTYGPIPYSKIGENGKINVEYDSQEQVYDTMFGELDEAIDVLTANRLSGISANVDFVYDGTAEKWCKFANSLKLRLAMRIVYADEGKARRYAEEAVSNEIGVFTSNADNAFLRPSAFGDKGNPLYTSVKYNQVGGTDTGGDTHVAADIICYMNGYEDPRRPEYFVPCLFEGFTYAGIPVSCEKPALKTIGYKYSGVNISSSDPLMWMNAAEVAFLRAEAAAVFGFDMGGSAEDFYNEGIRLSFEQWGVAGAEKYLENNVLVPQPYIDPAGLNSYSVPLSSLTVKWDESASPAEKQERIMIQKWIANFNLGNEAWADHRRTGFPVFIPATDAGNKSKGVVDNVLGARRMPYPQEEYTNNNENITAAVGSLLKGKDNYATPVWWDCNPAVWSGK